MLTSKDPGSRLRLYDTSQYRKRSVTPEQPHTAKPEKPKNKESLLTTEEAAELLGVAVKTIQTWVADRYMPFVKLSTKCLRFDRNDLEQWKNDKKIKP
jgi:excisionase family DNA binding protein